MTRSRAAIYPSSVVPAAFGPKKGDRAWRAGWFFIVVVPDVLRERQDGSWLRCQSSGFEWCYYVDAAFFGVGVGFPPPAACSDVFAGFDGPGAWCAAE